jgi:FkbM family methyltransferase
MRRWWNVRRFDLLELVLLSVFAGFLTWVVLHTLPKYPADYGAFKKAYGPNKFSENAEEWIIRDFFQDRRNGVFVDVGAAHFVVNSNTYFLETQLGWSGIAVEPFPHFEADYRTYRSRTRFLPFFVADKSGEEARLYTLPGNFLASSSDKSFVERFGKDPKEFKAPTITMNELLDQAGIKTFDFLSMDIELSEPKALAGFDINRFRPALVCIEAHPEVRQQILDYFARADYVVVGKYLRADDKNLYFTPMR